jgi:hypothetical protein
MRLRAVPSRRTTAALCVLLVLATWLGFAKVALALEGPPCPPRAVEWALRASSETGVRIAPLRCGSSMLVRITFEDGPPLVVELSRAADPAFEHAGSIGVSPHLEVEDFKTLPGPEREGFARLVAWLKDHESDVDLGGSGMGPRSTGRIARHAALVSLAFALLLAVVATARERPPRADVVAAGALFVGTLAVRLWLGPWGPFHINGQGPLWILAAATSPNELAAYGSGYPALFGPIAHAFSEAPDTAIFAANATLSALFPALLFALARTVGVAQGPAAWVAALASADPVAIRFGATESYLPVLLAEIVGSTCLFVLFVRDWTHPQRFRALASLAAAMALVCSSVEVHPVALLPVALAPLLSLAAPCDMRAPRRVAFALVCVAAAASSALLGLTLSQTNVLEAFHAHGTGLTRGGPTLVLTAGALVFGYALARLAPRVRWLVPAGFASVVGALVTVGAFRQAPLWEASYLHLFAIAPLVLVSEMLRGLPKLFTSPAPAAAAALIALGTSAACPVVSRRTTEHDEYVWLRRELRSLDPGCRVAFVEARGRAVFFPPLFDPERLLRLRDDDSALQGKLAGQACAYYLHSSLCETEEGRPACDRFESELALEPRSRAHFRAKPSYEDQRYERATIEDVLYRVVSK